MVGSDTLLGRDLKEVLGAEGRNEITDFAANAEGSFGSEEGEAVYLHPLDAASVESVDAVLSAGNDLGATKAFELVQATERYVPLIDCTGALDNRPEARIWPDTPQAASGKQRLFVVAHPAASVIAQILEGLTSLHPIQRSVVEVFEPASERGQKGISELQQQTASLLSFKKLDKAVFDTQLSFNLLAAYGEEAPVHLSTIEHRIEMHLATLLARKGAATPIPMPSLRLIQARVFHGYSLSF